MAMPLFVSMPPDRLNENVLQHAGNEGSRERGKNRFATGQTWTRNRFPNHYCAILHRLRIQDLLRVWGKAEYHTEPDFSGC